MGAIMDLLGSILSSMEKPPENKEEKKARMSKLVTHVIVSIALYHNRYH